MQTQYQKVREFMQAFGQECPEKVGFPPPQTCDLRVRLNREECVKELRLAIKSRDIVKAFDSGLDGLVVVLGTLIAFGITEEMVAKGFAEVCRSSMSKFWTAREIDSKHFKPGYKYVSGTSYASGRYVVIDPSGKIIKSPSYSPANLGPILEGKG